MSLSINFEPHSYYKGWTIKQNEISTLHPLKWSAVTDDGLYTYTVISLSARTLQGLKNKINKDIEMQAEKTARLYK